jgi:hypothetical protein
MRRVNKPERKLNKGGNFLYRGSFLFWQRWLFYTSLLFALFGITFAIYGDNPLFMPYNRALAQIFWQSSEIPAEVAPFRAFIWGPLGGTIACCYLLLAYIARYPFRRKESWARNAIIVAFGTWIILDSAVSLNYGVYYQVYIINAFSFLIKALPLIFTWKDFQKPAVNL